MATWMKEVQNEGDTCTCMADTFFCTAETNTTLHSNCTPIKLIVKEKNCVKRNKPTTKRQILYNSTEVRCLD